MLISSIRFPPRLFGFADDAFDVPVEVTHLLAAPGLAGRNTDDAGIVGDGTSERIKTLAHSVGRGGDEGTNVGWYCCPKRRDRHHALAKTLPHHGGLECPGDHALRRFGHERTPGEAEPGDPEFRRQLRRLDRLETDRIRVAACGGL